MDFNARALLKSVGIVDLDRPSSNDVHRAIEAALRGTISPEVVGTFVREAAVAPGICLEALKMSAAGGVHISAKAIDVIHRAMPILEAALEAAESSAEREKVREQVIDLVREARTESDRNRSFLLKVAGIAGGVALTALGIAVVVATKGRNRAVLEAGAKRIRI